MKCEKQKISSHKKTRLGVKQGPTDYVRKTTEGHAMYVFKITDGSHRYSVTKHCSEKDADAFCSAMNN